MEYANSAVGETIKNDVYSLIQYDYPGIIGVEAAASYWGLSTFNPAIPIFLVNDDNADSTGLFVESALSMLYVPNVNTDNLIQLSEHLRITDPEQTVCDMVRYGRHDFHLFETLLNAYDGDVDIERLERLAEYYNILDKMRELYKSALETEEEG